MVVFESASRVFSLLRSLSLRLSPVVFSLVACYFAPRVSLSFWSLGFPAVWFSAAGLSTFLASFMARSLSSPCLSRPLFPGPQSGPQSGPVPLLWLCSCRARSILWFDLSVVQPLLWLSPFFGSVPSLAQSFCDSVLLRLDLSEARSFCGSAPGIPAAPLDRPQPHSG